MRKASMGMPVKGMRKRAMSDAPRLSCGGSLSSPRGLFAFALPVLEKVAKAQLLQPVMDCQRVEPLGLSDIREGLAFADHLACCGNVELFATAYAGGGWFVSAGEAICGDVMTHQAALPLDIPQSDGGADLPLSASSPLRMRKVSEGKVWRLRQFETACCVRPVMRATFMVPPRASITGPVWESVSMTRNNTRAVYQIKRR
jgi:hypothetical protein